MVKLVVFLGLEEEWINIVKDYVIPGYETKTYLGRVENYTPVKPNVCYVSPANSFCFMDGGIDLAYSRVMFPGIEQKIKWYVSKWGEQTTLGRPYLPIGAAITHEVSKSDAPVKKYLITSPTMLLPQPVGNTRNAYYATRAVLDAVDRINQSDMELIVPPMCCGYGKMSARESATQIIQAFNDHKRIAMPSWSHILAEQPKLYENTEWTGF